MGRVVCGGRRDRNYLSGAGCTIGGRGDDDDVFCKDSYAIRYYSRIAEVDFVLEGGYYRDLEHAGEPLPDIPLPEVPAADVVAPPVQPTLTSGFPYARLSIGDRLCTCPCARGKGRLRTLGGILPPEPEPLPQLPLPLLKHLLAATRSIHRTYPEAASHRTECLGAGDAERVER